MLTRQCREKKEGKNKNKDKVEAETIFYLLSLQCHSCLTSLMSIGAEKPRKLDTRA